MARLIDAKALMDAFRTYMVERYDRGKCVSEENCKTCDKPCLWRSVVSVAPTVDAMLVRHGHWITHNPNNPFEIYGECSECGLEQSLSESLPYCPFCGAKMDEKEENYDNHN